MARTKSSVARKSVQLEGAKRHVDAEWFDRLLGEANTTRTEISKAIDVRNPNMLSKILTGKRQCKIEEAVFIAQRFRVTIQDVLERLGFDPPAPRCTVIGRVTPLSRVSYFTPTEAYEVDAPPVHGAAVVALRLEMTDSKLALYSGDLLFFEPSKHVQPGYLGRLCVVKMADQESPYVGVPQDAGVRQTRVDLLGKGEAVVTHNLVSAAPVEWIKIK